MNNNYVTQGQENEDKREWYESLWGLVILSVGLNVLSSWLYDKGRERIRKQDQLRERKRERKHLQNYHDKTYKQAKDEEADSNKILMEENPE